MSKIKDLINQMSLEEKCSLLSGTDFWHTQNIDRLGIKAVMVSDGPHGLRKQDMTGDHLGINDSIKAVCFPAASATAASFDRDLLKELGENMGTACQHEEVAINLGPAVNIKRSPLCGRNFEYFSEDPYLTAQLATALIKGTQSKNIGTSIKHFAANNQENRRMSSSSVVDERTLREIYFPAFETAVKEAQPWTVMCSYNRINGVFSSMNKWLLTDVLRDEWGFNGYVMTDWGAVTDRIEGVKAGLDLEMPASGGYHDRMVMKAVQEGRLSEEDLDKCIERLLTVHERYFENAKPETVWDKEAQHETAGRMAAECMVLLKNDGAILPLNKEDKIAVIGEFAAKPRFQGGGSSHINSFKVTSLIDAMEGMDYVYAQGYGIKTEEPDEALIEEAKKAAASCGKVVIVAGLPDSFESEGYDRTHIRMPKCQVKLIEEVAAVNENVIVVLYNGSPVEMPWLNKVKAVVEGYLGGQNVGTATRSILFGDVNPCGRLPETFPLKLEDNPSYLTYGGDTNVDEVVYNEGVFVGYRYYDQKKMDVLFPFGYGLSYTDFAYSNLKLDKDSMKDTDTLKVSVDVTNTGKKAGKEVVQLYVKPHKSEVARPVMELKEFAKVALEPGETKTVTFELSKRAFAYWSVEAKDWYVETGDFGIVIARNSREAVLEANVKVEGTLKIRKHYTVNTIFADIMKDPEAMQALAPVFGGMMKAFGVDESKDSAVSDDMGKAMMLYMPMRALASFSQGAISLDMLNGILDQLNARP